jgi:lysophospholipase L1-like esterase
MKICVFGDSLAWGAKDYKKGGWVERLKCYFIENCKDVHVYNLSLFADNTDGLLKRFETEAKSRKADMIIFAIGINDSLYLRTKDNRNVDLDRFKSNLLELVRIAQNIADNVMFIGLTKVDETKTMPRPTGIPERFYENESIVKYDTVIREFCEKNALVYVDMKEVIKIEDLEDGLHPNSQGHEKIFKAILKALDKFMRTQK